MKMHNTAKAICASPVLSPLFAVVVLESGQDRRTEPLIGHQHIALVIGHASHLNHPLRNPRNDADVMPGVCLLPEVGSDRPTGAV
jgi:hypothetical protein